MTILGEGVGVHARIPDGARDEVLGRAPAAAGGTRWIRTATDRFERRAPPGCVEQPGVAGLR